MSDLFFEKPVLNSPYDYPQHHWELDEHSNIANQVIVINLTSDVIQVPQTTHAGVN